MSKLNNKEEDLDWFIEPLNTEVFSITSLIRYKKKEVISNVLAKEEYRLQQMWQGDKGTQRWEWVEYID